MVDTVTRNVHSVNPCSVTGLMVLVLGTVPLDDMDQNVNNSVASVRIQDARKKTDAVFHIAKLAFMAKNATKPALVTVVTGQDATERMVHASSVCKVFTGTIVTCCVM